MAPGLLTNLQLPPSHVGEVQDRKTQLPPGQAAASSQFSKPQRPDLQGVSSQRTLRAASHVSLGAEIAALKHARSTKASAEDQTRRILVPLFNTGSAAREVAKRAEALFLSLKSSV
jgi:hypothetical protein